MIYIIASIVIVLLNVVPAFMPPTWTVISFLYITYDIHLGLMSVIGALSSSIGRFLLARISRVSVPKLFDDGVVSNMQFLGSKINGGRIRLFVIAFIWAISPIGSNPLFIAIGMTGARIRYILLGFFLGRCLSYFTLAYTSKIIVDGLRDILLEGILDWRKVMINALSFVVIIAYLLFDWQTFLVNGKVRFYKRLFRKRKNSSTA